MLRIDNQYKQCYDEREDTYMTIVVTFLATLVIGAISYEIVTSLYYGTLRYEVTQSTAKVNDKNYLDGYTTTTMMKIGKTMVPQVHNHPEEYIVYLLHDGSIHRFNSKALYNSVKLGSIIPVSVHIGYDKRNREKHKYLTLNVE